MKKTKFLILPLLILTIIYSSARAQASLMDDAVNKLALNVTDSLPKDVHFRLIAIGDIEGDDIGLQRALTSAIKDKTDFMIIERADLNKILNEHGMQLSDLVDKESRVRFGEIQGVEGILIGNIIEKKAGALSASLKAHIKLDNVERGEIILASDYTAEAVSPWKGFIIFIAVIFAALIVISIWLALRRKRMKMETLQEDYDERANISKEIDKATRNLAQVREVFRNNGHSEDAIALNDLDAQLSVLKQKVENEAWHGVGTEYKDAKNALRVDEGVMSGIRCIVEESDILFKEALDKNFNNVESHINALKKRINDAVNKFQDRREFIRY